MKALLDPTSRRSVVVNGPVVPPYTWVRTFNLTGKTAAFASATVAVFLRSGHKLLPNWSGPPLP